MSQQNPSEESQFKVIIAIKCVKEHSQNKIPNIRAIISIQEREKSSTLPFNEGQFFDLKDLDTSKPIKITFFLEKTNKEIGVKYVNIPEVVLTKEEYEITNEFSFSYNDSSYEGNLKGSYYIIILNRSQFLKEKSSGTPKKQVHYKEDISQKLKSGRKSQTFESKKEEMKRQNSLKKLSDRVEESVKSAVKEYSNQTSPKEQNNQIQVQVNEDPESPNRISQQIQITRSEPIMEKLDAVLSTTSPIHTHVQSHMQTFHLDSQRRSSPSLNHSPYKSHVHENLSCLYYIDQANMSDQLKTQSDYFKKIIYALNQKIVGLKSIQNNNDRLQIELERAEERNRQLTEMLYNSQENNRLVRTDINKTVELADVEKNDLLAQIRRKTDTIYDLEQKNSEQTVKIQALQTQIALMDRKVSEILAQSRQGKQADQKVTPDPQKQFENKLQELKSIISGLEQQKSDLSQSLNKANNDIINLKQSLLIQQQQTKEVQHELGMADRKVQIMKSQEIVATILQDQISQLQRDVSEALKQKDFVANDNEGLKKQIEMLKVQIQKSEKTANEKINSIFQKNNECEQKIANLEMDIEIQNKTNLQLRADNKSLQQGIQITKEHLIQIETEKKRNQNILKQLKESQQRENELNSKLSELNQNLYSTKQENSRLLSELEETKEYCSHVKNLILDMKEQGIAYIPFHDDPIDKALAEFINTLKDPKRVKDLFIRESEGVYMFGQRKVYIKAEKDRVLIKTGGGFMGIEEFLDLQVDQEIEKLEKDDMKKQYQQNLALHQKIDSSKVVKQFKNTSSPVNKK